MEYKVIASHSVEDLNKKVKIAIELGWEIVGSHHVVVTDTQNRFSGSQIHGSHSTVEYSQTMIHTLKN